MIVANPKLLGQAGKLETQGRVDIALKSEGRVQIDHPLPWGTSALFLLRPSIDWMWPTYIMEDNLLFSKSTKN